MRKLFSVQMFLSHNQFVASLDRIFKGESGLSCRCQGSARAAARDDILATVNAQRLAAGRVACERLGEVNTSVTRRNF